MMMKVLEGGWRWVMDKFGPRFEICLIFQGTHVGLFKFLYEKNHLLLMHTHFLLTRFITPSFL